MSFVHERNIKIWKENKNFFSSLPGYGKSYKYEQNLGIVPIGNHPGLITVVQQDTLDVGRDLMKINNARTAVLNMCDPVYPGGIIDGGAITQEEDLWRRSDLFKWLTRDLYPLHQVSGIYTEKVIVNRKSSLEDYIPEDEPYLMNFISVPAVVNPYMTPDLKDFLRSEDKDLMLQRCQLIFEIAAKHKVRNLVLSAWGCGAFKCPIPGTINIFKECLKHWRYNFDHIVFAILGRNYAPFYSELNLI